MTAARYFMAASLALLLLAAIAALAPMAAPDRPVEPIDWSAGRHGASLAELATRFDTGALPAPASPEPVSPPPPPDPALMLRRYRLIGVAISDERAAGVFEKDGATWMLAQGDELEGFLLAQYDAASAVFRKDGGEVRIFLETVPQ